MADATDPFSLDIPAFSNLINASDAQINAVTAIPVLTDTGSTSSGSSMLPLVLIGGGFLALVLMSKD